MRIEIAPLVDIVLVLLIFFAVLAGSLISKKGMSLELPNAKTIATHQKGIIISIDQKGVISLNQDTIEKEQLTDLIKEQLKQDPDLHVVLFADKTTSYETAIDVLDKIRLGGCFDVVLEAKNPTL